MTNRAAALEYFVFDAISSATIPIKEYANFYNLECPKNSTGAISHITQHLQDHDTVTAQTCNRVAVCICHA